MEGGHSCRYLGREKGPGAGSYAGSNLPSPGHAAPIWTTVGSSDLHLLNRLIPGLTPRQGEVLGCSAGQTASDRLRIGLPISPLQGSGLRDGVGVLPALCSNESALSGKRNLLTVQSQSFFSSSLSFVSYIIHSILSRRKVSFHVNPWENNCWLSA